MRRWTVVLVAMIALALTLPAGAALAQVDGGQAEAAAKKKGKKKKGKKKAKPKRVTVCKRGCKFRSIQRAVNATGKNATIRIKPGVYSQGAIVKGHGHDGLTIRGIGKGPKAVVLDGKNAKGPGGVAQNGVEGDQVSRLKVLNLTVRNFVANGVFVHGESKGCNGYLMNRLIAANNRSYGLFALECKGGTMSNSEGYGHGDSAFYIGQTPPQQKPKWTTLTNLKGHTNVLGYSGTNSKYVKITKSDFFNNGVGIVPNTLDSEDYEPAANGIIEDNDIFWNNFNYYLPNSPVKTVSGGLGQVGDLTVNYPIGIGIVNLGTDGWIARNNRIFGNFMWGAATISDPFNVGEDATNLNNRFINNTMGRGGTDTNQFDFFNDGSGSGNCFQGNTSSTFHDLGAANPGVLYTTCPATAGNGTVFGETDQFNFLVDFVGSEEPDDPPQNQQCFWDEHPHPPFGGYTPLNITPGPVCAP